MLGISRTLLVYFERRGGLVFFLRYWRVTDYLYHSPHARGGVRMIIVIDHTIIIRTPGPIVLGISRTLLVYFER